MIHYLRKANKKELQGTVLLRLDFNTEDDWRMRAVLPTIRFLLASASKIVIVSHEGRPKRFEKKLSLRRKARDLERMLGRRVIFCPRFSFRKIRESIKGASEKSIFVLENIRFLKGESTEKPELAKTLASLADYYVNDAFAVSHRGSDSVAKVEKFLPSFAGLELEKEVKSLSRVMKKPQHPLMLILGGGKAADKLSVIKNLRNKVDIFLLGGAPANTILFLRGMDVKKSLRDGDIKDLKKLETIIRYPNLCLPVDAVWKKGAMVDVGPKTRELFRKKIKNARTILWSGPLGLIESPLYSRGTLDLARAIVKNHKAFSLAGGGETVMFLKKHKLDKKFSFISTGGGAMLEFLANKKLPGIEALKKSHNS